MFSSTGVAIAAAARQPKIINNFILLCSIGSTVGWSWLPYLYESAIYLMGICMCRWKGSLGGGTEKESWAAYLWGFPNNPARARKCWLSRGVDVLLVRESMAAINDKLPYRVFILLMTPNAVTKRIWISSDGKLFDQFTKNPFKWEIPTNFD